LLRQNVRFAFFAEILNIKTIQQMIKKIQKIGNGFYPNLQLETKATEATEAI
jgi:hypothetical protein